MVLDGSVLDYSENPFKMEVELNYSVLWIWYFPLSLFQEAAQN